MGLDFIIGEAKIVQEPPDGKLDLSNLRIVILENGLVTIGYDKETLELDVSDHLSLKAEVVQHAAETDEEKAHNWMVQGRNEWGCSASAFHDTVTEARLETLFDEREGCLYNHKHYPGAVLIRKRHVEQVEQALKRAKMLKDFDAGSLRVLTWLAYWMAWAVKACRIPVFYTH